jgi:hypothetical protein
MTTIINDVDVSGCEFYDNYECNCYISECWEQEDRSKMMCKQVDDCYYKQLQRTKQDNINIKKAFNDILLEILEMQPYDGEIRADGNTPLVVIRNYKKEYRQYKQTLQEIKEIAEKLMADNLCNNCDGIGLDANCQDTGCPYYQMDAILQKITKEDEE